MKYRIATVAIGWLLAMPGMAQDAATRTVREAMVDSASALLASVAARGAMGADRHSSLALQLDNEQRVNWQFWPTERVGLPIENMNADQRMLVHKLLTSALSSNGYLKVVHIMQLEQILEMLDQGGVPRSVDHYVVALFGTPTLDSEWGWRFEGHHVSLNVAVSPAGVSVTPSFLGSNPAEVRSGPLAGFRVHGINEDLARDLVNSLGASERARAIIAPEPPSEIFTGNIRKDRSQWDLWIETLQPQGISVASLNEVQQHWVRRIIDEVVGNYRPELAAGVLQSIDLDELSFAWMGATEKGSPHYFRLQGTDFMFEYDNVQNSGNHVHAVWRSKSSDFGQRILERHYQSAAH